MSPARVVALNKFRFTGELPSGVVVHPMGCPRPTLGFPASAEHYQSGHAGEWQPFKRILKVPVQMSPANPDDREKDETQSLYRTEAR